MLKVGLTGGIACGKSLAAAAFQACGAAVVDADSISRQVVEPGRPGWHRIVEHFGSDALHADSALNRERLAGIVFADAGKRAVLNALLHPLILDELLARIGDIEAAGRHSVIVADVPLLFESGWQNFFDRTVVIWAGRRVQVQRLARRDRLSVREAAQRLRAQMSTDEKARRADYVIKNTGSPDACTREVTLLYKRLLRAAGQLH
jgi:dephospho-CoA kinase